MEQRFSLGRGGGTLVLRDEGPRVVFEAEMPDDGQGLYKAHITGAGGGLLLGTLVPEHGRLRLRRTLSIGELARMGCWPVTGGEARLAFSFGQGGQDAAAGTCPPGWIQEKNPARLMGDRVLAHVAGELRGALLRRTEEGFSLAAPFTHGAAFPMATLFCFAQVEILCHRPYAVFYFNGHGCPIFQNKGNTAGHTDGANQ